MNYYLDTEFMEDGRTEQLTLLSIGIVDEGGGAFYAVNAEADLSLANEWVRDNVIPSLADPQHVYHATRQEIAQELQKFIRTAAAEPKFYGYFCDYDWVLFCQLFGRMVDLPMEYPKYCLDLKQMMYHWGITRSELPKMEGTAHNALDDARWNREVHRYLQSRINVRIKV